MSLKPIPVEQPAKNTKKQDGKKHTQSFNPYMKKKKDEHSLKNITLGLVRYINRGSKYTTNQIDEIIIGMQRSILRLQQDKQDSMKKNIDKKSERKKK